MHQTDQEKIMQQLQSVIEAAFERRAEITPASVDLSLIHISEPTRLHKVSRMPSSA